MTSIQKSAGNPSIDYTVWLLTESGNVFVMLPFSIILLIIRRTRKIGMILLILLVLSSLITGYVKCGVDRDRPFLDWLGSELPFEVEPDSLLWTDFRTNQEMKNLFLLFKKSGFIVEREKDITQNIIRALELLTPYRKRQIKKHVPSVIQGVFFII